MNITIQTIQSVSIVIPEGRLDTLSSSDFDRSFDPLLSTEKFLIIDLTLCNYLSSAGIRSLVKCEKKLGAKGGCLLLVGLSAEIYQVVEMTGLHRVFKLFSNQQNALAEIYNLKQAERQSSEVEIDNYLFQFNSFETQGLPALLWNEQGIAGYDELGFSIGIGSSAENLSDVQMNEGVFVTTGNCAGFIPFNKQLLPDFRIPQNLAGNGIFIQKAISFAEKNSSTIRLVSSEKITLHQLCKCSETLRNTLQPCQLGPLALVVADFNTTTPSVSVISLLKEELWSEIDEQQLMSDNGIQFSPGNTVAVLGARFILDELAENQSAEILSDFLKNTLTLENINDVGTIDLSTLLSQPQIWLLTSSGMIHASARRMQVVLHEGLKLKQHEVFLARRLYADSSKMVIKPLHGGYSAQTFQVESFDKEGRKLRPTVMKIANRAMIEREADRCKQYAMPYILNNSAIVLGAEFFGDTGALRYNFVGIGGEQTRLSWLTHIFESWETSELEPLFDKIFLQILNPWYGQPVKKPIFLFNDHDPTLTFFPAIFEVAEKSFSISSDDKYLMVHEIGKELINPYWFLKHEYPKRREVAVDYYTSVCHGDLNMQNILLDQNMNVYLIDFSETRPRSVVSDFARLEAIFMIEYAKLDSEEEMKRMIEFASEFYAVGQLDQFPENHYRGNHSAVISKNVTMIRRLREYALKSSNGDVNITPYYVALLEWILPIICYSSAPEAQKRFSTVVAALLCEKVITH